MAVEHRRSEGETVESATQAPDPGRGTRGARSGATRGVGSPAALRASNRSLVVSFLGDSGPLTHRELAERTGLSRTTVLNVVRDLLAADHVALSTATRAGRRVKEITLSRRSPLVLGIDFGHRHVRIALADPSDRVVAEEYERLPDSHHWEEDLRVVVRLLARLHERTATGPDCIAAAGLGLPAPIDPGTGEVGSSSILPGWVGVAAERAVTSVLEVPVYVDNDANLGALAEGRWGSAQGCRDFLYVKLSTGIGAGLVLNGELYRGFAGTAGEIGHITVNDSGEICTCGNRGCLETVAGGRAVLAQLTPLFGTDLSLPGAVALAVDGDPRARRAIADAGRTVGFAVASVYNLLAPAKVIFGGDLSGAGEVLLEPIREVVRRHATPSAANAAGIVAGNLGERAELLGALAAARTGADRRLQQQHANATTEALAAGSQRAETTSPLPPAPHRANQRIATPASARAPARQPPEAPGSAEKGHTRQHSCTQTV